ncbi:unnamed protein product [Cercopithifilaria johnstoni]|uniref:Uncharacterized protein n=1 Tax=Cercopithifilaria johnstoni TaxID=2874296 RepID=A0A8J2LW19_9BILA|nr:unnamed protein product [Cercopithifilaria johnstoni]
MSVFLRGMQPQNGFTAKTIRFVEHCKGLQVGWTHNKLRSQGVEEFVEEYLPWIRKNNPHIEIRLYRTHVNCDPFVIGVYEHCRVRKRRCDWKTKHQVLSFVEEMALGGDYVKGRKRGVKTILPRGLQLWSTETIGHDVFKVYSKWKGDAVDPMEITSASHPYFIHRKHA